MKDASARGRAAKNKGKVGEREAAELLKRYGFTARRAQQFAGGATSQDLAHDLDGFHIEVKRTETLSVYEAMAQARRDAKVGSAPLVLHRRSGKEWLAVMRAEDLLELISTYVFEPGGTND